MVGAYIIGSVVLLIIEEDKMLQYTTLFYLIKFQHGIVRKLGRKKARDGAFVIDKLIFIILFLLI